MMGEIELAAVMLLAIMLFLAAAGGILVVLLWGQPPRPRLAASTPVPLGRLSRSRPLGGPSMMRQERGQGMRYLSMTPSALARARRPELPTPRRRPSPVPGYPAAWLLVQGGPLGGRRYPLARPSLTLGRSVTCDITLPDPEASRQHARLEWGLDGLYVVDAHSTNGTYVNGLRIGQARLRGGERIQVGQTTFVIGIR